MIPLADNIPFVTGVITVGLVSLGSIVFGLNQFQKPAGKIAAIAGGVLLGALILFVGVVLFLVWSSERGAPL